MAKPKRHIRHAKIYQPKVIKRSERFSIQHLQTVLCFLAIIVTIIVFYNSSNKKDDNIRHQESSRIAQEQLAFAKSTNTSADFSLKTEQAELRSKQDGITHIPPLNWLQSLPPPQAIQYLTERIKYAPLPENYAELGLNWAYAGYYKQAQYNLDIAEKMASDEAYVYKARGITHLINHQNEAAEQAFIRAIDLNPLDMDNLHLMSFVLLSKNQPKLAAQLLNELTYKYPQNTLLLLNLCCAHIACKAFDKARYDAEKILRLRPDDAVAHFYLGQIASSEHKFDEAIIHYSKGLVSNQAVIASSSLLNRATIYQKIGDDVNAKKDYQKISELYPDNAFLARQLGWLAFKEKRNSEAQQYFDRADSLDPKSICYTSRLLLCNRLHGADSAIRMSKQLLRNHPNNIDLLYKTAILLYFQGQDYQAYNYAERLWKLTQTSADVMLLQGKLAQRKAAYEEALLWYNRAIEIAPDYFESYFLRGILHLNQKEFNLAFLDFQAAVNNNSKHAPSLLGRGLCFGYFQEMESATRDFDTVWKLDSRLQEITAPLLEKRLTGKGYAIIAEYFAECFESVCRTDFESYIYYEPTETLIMLVKDDWPIMLSHRFLHDQRVYQQH